MAVKRLRLLIQEVPIEQLGEAAIEILLRHALRQAEAQHDSVGELLVALHSPKIPLASHLLLQQTRAFFGGRTLFGSADGSLSLSR
jgi:hypothetical protein